MHRWLKTKGLPSPQTAFATPEALEKMQRPAILKPREGTGGVGVQSIHDPAALKDLDPSQWLLQETLQAYAVAVNMFFSRSAAVFRCVCREALEMRGGVPTKARIFDDRALASLSERLARSLPLFGTSVFEVMRDAADRWRIIDVNPRAGVSTRMCAAVGLDFAAANLADYWGEPTEPMFRPLDGEHYIMRQYANYVTNPSIR
jgi:predicted ATP-grasp superfamily ATP-dependent carboligase